MPKQDSKPRRKSKSRSHKADFEGRMIARLIQTFDRFPPEAHAELTEILIDLGMLSMQRDPGVTAIFFTSAITRIAKLLDQIGGDTWREQLSNDMCFAVNYSEDERGIARPSNVMDFSSWKQSHPRPIKRCVVEV